MSITYESLGVSRVGATATAVILDEALRWLDAGENLENLTTEKVLKEL